MSKHTPGPWSITNGTILGSDGVGVTRPISRFDGAADANAHLIAAAPDLYEACKKLAMLSSGAEDDDAYAEVPWSVIEDARAALAKAEGVTK